MDNDIMYDKLSSLSEISKAQISKILKSIEGAKDLILEPQIIKPLERVCDINWLKQNGVNKIFKLEPKLMETQFCHVFMIYSNFETFKHLMEAIQSDLSTKTTKKQIYHVICVPKFLYAFEDLLEENGLIGFVRLYSLQWLPIHLDQGILSLELPSMYKQIFVTHDLSLLPSYGKSLWQLFLISGKPKFSLSLGRFSNVALKHFDEYSTQKVCTLQSEYSGLIIVDRSLDYPSTLLTPCTYSGLLNEVYSVHCGHCKYEEDNVGKYDGQFNRVVPKQSVNFALNSKRDEIYNRIKNMYFTEVTVALSNLTKELRNEGQNSKSMGLNEMKKYVETKLQSLTVKKKLVTNHLNVSETIISSFSHKFEKLNELENNILHNKSKNDNLKSLEEYLQTENDKYSSLALLILIAITQKITENELKSFLDKYFVEFGYNLGFLYRNLLNNILDPSFLKLKLPNLLLTQNNFFTYANKLKQIPADPTKVNFKVPNCCSYAFGGLYVPLIAQICSILLSGCPVDDLKSKLEPLEELTIKGSFDKGKKALMVCVIGGISYSEIAALNLLEKLTGTKIIALSDKIVSKRDIVDAFITL